MTLLAQLHSFWLRRWYAAHGIEFNGACRLSPAVSLERGVSRIGKGVITIGSNSELGRGACLHAWGGRITLGSNVFIGPFGVIYGHGGVEIGRDSLVSMHCRILSSNHTIPAPGVPIRSQPDIPLPTRIGQDVWLGAGVTVLGGVTIGDGAVVGAGAVVSRDIPSNSIAIGVPATVVRRRT